MANAGSFVSGTGPAPVLRRSASHPAIRNRFTTSRRSGSGSKASEGSRLSSSKVAGNGRAAEALGEVPG